MKRTIVLGDLIDSPVDKGVYNVVCSRVGEIRNVGTDNTEVVDITWKIVDGPAEGKSVRDTYWLEGDSLKRFPYFFMNILGIPKEELPTYESTEDLVAYLTESAVDAKAVIEVDVVTKGEVEYNKVTKTHAAA